MAKREFILAADPFIQPVTGRTMREVQERAGGGPWQVRLIVANDEAIDVLDALRRAYQDGREDHAGEYGPDRWQVLRNWLTARGDHAAGGPNIYAAAMTRAFDDTLAKMRELEG